jgi:hypothetical protein
MRWFERFSENKSESSLKTRQAVLEGKLQDGTITPAQGEELLEIRKRLRRLAEIRDRIDQGIW